MANCLKSYDIALAGVAQWIECRPVNQKVGWFDSKSGHMPGLCGPGPLLGACERRQIDVSLIH